MADPQMTGSASRPPARPSERLGWPVVALLTPLFVYLILPRWADYGQVTFPLAAVLFTWVPGYLLCRHVPSWYTLDRWLAHGVSIMLGIGLLGSVSVLTKILHLPMHSAGWAVWGVAFLATLPRTPRGLTPRAPPIEGKNHPIYLVAALALSITMILVRPVFYQNPVQPGEVRDEWLYAAYIHRSVTQPDEFLPSIEVVPSIGLPTRMVVNGWTQLQATLSAITEVSPALISFSGLQPLVMLLSLWSAYALARVLLMRRDMALVAVCFFALYHLSRVNEFPRSALLWQQDKYVSVLALVNFVLALGVCYLRRPSADRLLILSALFWTVTTTHVFGLVASTVGLGAIWLAYYGRQVLTSTAVARLSLVAVSAVPAAAFALWHRSEVPRWVFALSAEIPKVATRHYTQHDWGWTISSTFIGDLSTQAAIYASLLAGVVAWRNLAARYVAVFTGLVLLITLTPVTALVVQVISTVQLVRFYWILPIGLAIACLLDAVRRYCPESSRRRYIPVTATLVLLAVGITAMFSSGFAGHVLKWSEQSQARMGNADYWLAETLNSTEEKQPLVVTGDSRSRMIALGLTDARIISYYEGFWGKRMRARSRAFNDDVLAHGDLQLLYGMPIDNSMRELYPQLDLPDYIRYDADYVVLRMGHPFLRTMLSQPKIFLPYASNRDYVVFRAPGISDARLVGWQKGPAYLALKRGRIDVAERLYADLAARSPDDPVAQLGYATATSRQGRECLARALVAKMLSRVRIEPAELSETDYVQRFFAPLGYSLSDVGLDLGVPAPRCDRLYAREHDLNLFVVPGLGSGLRPAVVVVHGGGWGTQRFHPTGTEFFRGLSNQGYTVIFPQYRGLPSRYPAGVKDVSCALAYVQEHAEDLKIDVNRISLWGQSSGVQVAALMLLHPPKEVYCEKRPQTPVASAVFVAGIYDPVGLLEQTTGYRRMALARELREWLGGTPAVEASPLARVKGITIPVLLVHGKQDRIAPLEQANRFYDKMRSAGNEIEMFVIGPAGHNVPSYLWDEREVLRNDLPDQLDAQDTVFGFLAGR